jgi:hypothetical protein
MRIGRYILNGLTLLSLSLCAQTRPSLPPPRELARLEGSVGGLVLFSPDGSKILTANGSADTVDR